MGSRLDCSNQTTLRLNSMREGRTKKQIQWRNDAEPKPILGDEGESITMSFLK